MIQDQQITAANTLNQKANRLILATATLIGAGCIIIIVLFVLTNNLLKKHQTLVQQKISTQESVSGTESLIGYVSKNLDSLKLILDIFPDELTIIETVQILESLVQTYDANAKVKFSSLTPVAKNNQLYIPLQLNLHTTPYNSINLLRQLERLPYVVEVTNYETKVPSAASSAAEINLGVVLYVQDPFRQAN